jgi:putative peptidoglycan binding protein
MKTPFFIALAMALPFAQSAQAEDHHDRSRGRNAPAQTQQAPAQAPRRPVVRAQNSGARYSQGSSVQRFNPSYPPHRISTATRTTPHHSTTTRTAPHRAADTSRIYDRPVVNRATSDRIKANNGRFRDRGREDNVATRNHSVAQKDRTARNNRDHRNYDRNSYNRARHRWVRTYHNRDWWRSHYNTTFVLFGGGYYYWDAGYWFPAYGYDPYYSTYTYDEPIYGYNDLAPGEVLENVQIALRDAGYYNGAIDGLIGPQTRAALRAFQRDNGLIVTEAVDEPTLAALGLT